MDECLLKIESHVSELDMAMCVATSSIAASLLAEVGPIWPLVFIDT